MERITEPWQVVVLGVLGLVFGVAFWVWLRAGQREAEADDAGPGEIVSRAWNALLDWRASGLQKEKVSASVSASESSETTVSEFRLPGETDAETAVADALARLILANELDLTTAVKVGCGKKSGEGYQKWSRLVKAGIERQQAKPTPIAERMTDAKFASDVR